MTKVALILLAMSVAIPFAAEHRDPTSRPMWRHTSDFVGLAFEINAHPCRAGVFLPDLEGMTCIGDPWGEEP